MSNIMMCQCCPLDLTEFNPALSKSNKQPYMTRIKEMETLVALWSVFITPILKAALNPMGSVRATYSR